MSRLPIPVLLVLCVFLALGATSSSTLASAAPNSVTFTIGVKSIFLHQEPTLISPRTYSVFQNQVFSITGRSADGTWLQLNFPHAAKGTWILAVYGTINGDLNPIEVIESVAPTVPTTLATNSASSVGASDLPVSAPTRVSFVVVAKSFFALSAPSWIGVRVESLFKGQTYNVRARSADGQWLQIDYTGATSDVWVSIAYGEVKGDLKNLPVAGASPTVIPVMPPWIPVITAHMRQVYQESAEYGQKLNVFTVAGDCNSEFKVYLGHGVDLLNSGYGWLDPTRAYFAPSFTEKHSIAALGGFTTGGVQDSSFSPVWCNGEGLFTCELNNSKASIVFILLGTGDHANWRNFGPHYRNLLSQALQHHVLPVVVTKLDEIETAADGAPPYYMNNIMRQLAQEYDVPLLDFWQAAQSLPKGGLQDDIHVTDEAMTLHLIVTLQTLAVIRSQP